MMKLTPLQAAKMAYCIHAYQIVLDNDLAIQFLDYIDNSRYSFDFTPRQRKLFLKHIRSTHSRVVRRLGYIDIEETEAAPAR